VKLVETNNLKDQMCWSSLESFIAQLPNDLTKLLEYMEVTEAIKQTDMYNERAQNRRQTIHRVECELI